MKENLVIVESPAKAKTIEKFLGPDYIVRSSYGHVRDLVTKGLGVDVENGFAPHYQIADNKDKLVAELSKLAAGSQTIWLASDEDREGEAIAWHLAQVLKLPQEKTRRIVFHEITRNAIVEAIAAPRDIDMNLVNAQQARRVLDRLVGFELSPVLWKKVRPKLSAGRVQSVAVRLIVEREREIIDFAAKKYFRVVGEFYLPGGAKKTLFKAELSKRFDTEQEAQRFLEDCRTATHTVLSAESKPASKSPAPPFTTSTLQQEAGRKLGMGVSRTMSVAQSLYENGYITYMRTDSVNLAKQAIAAIKEQVVKEFGDKYSQTRNFKTSTKGAQEAHEAIRPSYIERRAIEGTSDERRLYDLIWKRAVASQMAAAQIERTVVSIDTSSRKETFTATGEVVRFDGFLKLYSESTDEVSEQGDDNAVLPAMKVGDGVARESISAIESFTQPAPRYSEASLVKRLEELGIGRPSTYAPTITTIINRGYVVKDNREGVKRDYVRLTLDATGAVTSKTLSQTVGREKGKLVPTDIGMLVTDYLMVQFQSIMDYNFTATVEEEFDEIASGKMQWVKMIEGFYGGFHKTVDEALGAVVQNRKNLRVLGVDPATGKEISARIGRFGPMVQIGGEDGEKARFASLKKGQLIESITLEEALELFSLPRTVGQLDGRDVVIGIGRFGPYALYDKKFTSLGRSDDPYTITLERAVEIIREKAASEAGAKTPLKTFAEEPNLLILRGRYGPYISFGGKNYRIPKGTEPAELTLDECRKIIEETPHAVETVREKTASEAGAKTPLKTFAEEPNLLILRGRYGPYIGFGGKNYRIPKGTEPAELTLDKCRKIIAEWKK
ncbi:MAG: type I DNA topoisomerase [Rikenellaceae bacterium]|jgi:DNA topoisomerase-1|nr:type I DNA topoisomerase [Rikenellaceae bacterium]